MLQFEWKFHQKSITITSKNNTVWGCGMRITTKGQVTIPMEIRNKLGLLPHMEVDFVLEGNRVYLKKIKTSESRGDRMIKQMQGKAKTKMSTDELMLLLRGDDE